MVAFDTNRSPAPALAYRAISGIYNFATMFQSWNDSRTTRKALTRLTARELDDIGLTFGDIDEIVAKGARP